MEFFEWDESFATNVQRFDDDHRNLLTLFNGVYHHVFECENLEEERELTQKTLVKLLEYVKYHFSAEEELMLQFDYPQYVSHKKEHGYYIAEVNKFLDQHKKGAAALSFPTFMFLKEWITKHILVRDKEYGEFFHAKGIR